MQARLTRSSSDKVLAGVCGGLGRYLGIDSNVVRVFFIILATIEGIGWMLYFVLWLLLPRQDDVQGADAFGAGDWPGRIGRMGSEFSQALQTPPLRARLWIGVFLLALGVFLALKQFNLFAWLDANLLWAVVLIIGGGILLLRAIQNK